MSVRLRPLLALCVLAPCIGIVGCRSVPRPDGAIFGPFYAPQNVRAAPALPHSVARVVLLPLTGSDHADPEVLENIRTVFRTEFTRAARAELAVIDGDRLQRLVGEHRVRTTEPLPDGFLARIREGTAADAVLFVEVTSFRPYPPLTLGIRARLVTTDSQETLWACDELFDARVAAVRNAARRHAATPAPQPGAPGDLSQTILQNPDRFAAYVAAALFHTLPPR